MMSKISHPTRRPWPRVGFATAMMAVAAAAQPGLAEDDPKPPRGAGAPLVELSARWSGRTGRNPRVVVRGRHVTVSSDCRDCDPPNAVLEATLTPESAETLRSALVASRFFEDWPVAPPRMHGSNWDVSLTLGDDTAHRRFPSQERWDDASGVLSRMTMDAESLHDLAVHVRVHHALGMMNSRIGRGPSLFTRDALIDALDSGLRNAVDLRGTWPLLEALAPLVPPERWAATAREQMARDDGRLRADLLRALGQPLPETAPLRRAEREFLSDVRAEIERMLADPPENLGDVTRLLWLPARERDRSFVDLMCRVADELSTPENPLPPPYLAALGEPAIPVAARYLRTFDTQSRKIGAQLVEQLAELPDRRFDDPPFSEGELADLRARIHEELVPLLQNILADEKEDHGVRYYARDALAELGLAESNREIRDRAHAEAAARRGERNRTTKEGEAAGAARVPETPPKGDLSISGRVVTDLGEPVAGASVSCQRATGDPLAPRRLFGTVAETDAEGAFRVDGLVAGPFLVVPSLHGFGAGRSVRWAGSMATVADVAAGSTGVEIVIRVGHTIRGRLLDVDAQPLARRHVVARMRAAQDPAATDGRTTVDAETADDGAFWLTELREGRFDLDLMPHVPSTGGDDIPTGATGVVVRVAPAATISGRVQDERGAPFHEGFVYALPIDDPRGDWRSVHADPNGGFVIPDLDPGRTYRVVARATSDEFPGDGNRVRTVFGDEVRAAAGTEDVALSIDLSPRLSFRIVRVTDGLRWTGAWRLSGDGRTFSPRTMRFSGVPEGRWDVAVRARRRLPDRTWETLWYVIGIVCAGDEDVELVVPEWAELPLEK